MKPFRERSPGPIGAIGIAVLALALLAAFNVEKLPFVGGGDVYYANFSESAMLQPGSNVLIAGVAVGTVESVELEGAHVRVTFQVDPAVEFGEASRAEIKIATALGDKYLAIVPKGRGTMTPGSTIPLPRTDPPFRVVKALDQTTRTVGRIDTRQLATALDTLATAFEGASEEVQGALRGLTRLSKTISSRDAKLAELLDHAEAVTQVLEERNREFTTLLTDADLLLKELDRRSDVIHQLLVNTTRLSNQLIALVEENQDQLEPALQRLEEVTGLLRRKRADLERSIDVLAQYTREFTDTVGTGRWFDVYLQNVAPVPPTVRTPEE